MDTIKELFKDFKDRLSSPFFASFLISWLILNWPIVIAVLLYKQNELVLDNYRSYYDLINQRQNNCNMIIYPIGSAFLYCLGFPWIKSGIRWIQAKATSFEDRAILRSTKAGWMPFKRYIEMRDSMQITINQLQELHDKESVIQAENNELTNKINSLKNESITKDAKFNQLQSVMNDHNSKSNLQILQGRWRVTMVTSTNVEIVEGWSISGLKILEDSGKVYQIDNFISDTFSQKIFFSYVEANEMSKTMTLLLKALDGFNSFELDVIRSRGLLSFSMIKVN